MSIHKSQGQTLQYVKIDLAKVFEKGAVSFPTFRVSADSHIIYRRPELRRLVTGVLVRGTTSHSFQPVEGESLWHLGGDASAFCNVIPLGKSTYESHRLVSNVATAGRTGRKGC